MTVEVMAEVKWLLGMGSVMRKLKSLEAMCGLLKQCGLGGRQILWPGTESMHGHVSCFLVVVPKISEGSYLK